MARTLDKPEFCGSYNFLRRRSEDANIPMQETVTLKMDWPETLLPL
ncbi:hypothetical protein NHJ13051_008260 [Beauveria bassiana]